jgi:hypothetical protein
MIYNTVSQRPTGIDPSNTVTSDVSKSTERLINIANYLSNYWIEHSVNCEDPHCRIELAKALIEAKKIC